MRPLSLTSDTRLQFPVNELSRCDLDQSLGYDAATAAHGREAMALAPGPESGLPLDFWILEGSEKGAQYW
jgi:hypothetical protein